MSNSNPTRIEMISYVIKSFKENEPKPSRKAVNRLTNVLNNAAIDQIEHLYRTSKAKK